MYDTFDRTTHQQRAGTPRIATKVMCILATAQSVYVVAVLLTGSGIGLSRVELIHVFAAAGVGIPALYLLARDMLAAPNTRTNVKAFRLGVKIGEMRIWGMLRR